MKDETTKLMMAPTTEETCKANNGFVCKVRLDADDMTTVSYTHLTLPTNREV